MILIYNLILVIWREQCRVHNGSDLTRIHAKYSKICGTVHIRKFWFYNCPFAPDPDFTFFTNSGGQRIRILAPPTFSERGRFGFWSIHFSVSQRNRFSKFHTIFRSVQNTRFLIFKLLQLVPNSYFRIFKKLRVGGVSDCIFFTILRVRPGLDHSSSLKFLIGLDSDIKKLDSFSIEADQDFGIS